MNRCELQAAMTAWHLAINHKLSHPSETEDFEELAQSYGRAISKPEHIEEASHFFNWTHILAIFETTQPKGI